MKYPDMIESQGHVSKSMSKSMTKGMTKSGKRWASNRACARAFAKTTIFIVVVAIALWD